MNISKVEHLALLLEETAITAINQFLTEQGIESIGDFQPNMHYTLHYYGWKPNADRNDIPVADLGKTITITLDGFGFYVADGIVQNMGFRVSADCLPEISIGNGTLADLSQNAVPHITIAINPATDEEGKVIAKAVNTYKCVFHPLETPLVVEARLAVFRGGKVAFALD